MNVQSAKLQEMYNLKIPEFSCHDWKHVLFLEAVVQWSLCQALRPVDESSGEMGRYTHENSYGKFGEK